MPWATMDVTHAAGASPANFLDIGGGADEEKVARSLEIVLSDVNVKQVLVNIFGGILRCDVAARGFVYGLPRERRTRCAPMVVRMLGTNADEGRGDTCQLWLERHARQRPGRGGCRHSRRGMSLENIFIDTRLLTTWPRTRIQVLARPIRSR